MKEVKVLELDKYELGIIINALNKLRNSLLEIDEDTICVDELLLKVLDAPDKRRMFAKKYVEER